MFLALASASAQVIVGSPTTFWTSISYAGVTPDFSSDEQATSLDADFVGDLSNPSFCKSYWDGGTPDDETDGEIGFRFRMAGDKNPSGFKGVAYVGIDLNSDGSLDLFVGAANQGGSSEVGIWGAGSGANTSPSNTSVDSTALYSAPISITNYNWSPVNSTIDPGVTNTNIDGGSGGGADHTDHFLTFVVPFAALVDASKSYVPGGITESSTLTFVAATATQQNKLNQDLNGLPKNYDETMTWADLEVVSETYSPESISPIPEPSGFGLVMMGGLAVARLRRRLTTSGPGRLGPS